MSSLESLEQALFEVRGEVHLAPGLTDAEIDAALAPTGLRLPDEVRAYFRAHDGTHPPPDIPSAPWMIADWWPLPLAQALREREDIRSLCAEITAEEPEGTAETIWPARWLPLFSASNGDPLVVDCGDDQQAPTGSILRLVPMGKPHVLLASLDELFELFATALRSRAWDWDPVDGRWLYNRERMPTNPTTQALI